MESLEKELEDLGNERGELEERMNSGTMGHEELAVAAARVNEIIERTDEAEMRLLELMEKEG